MKYLVTAEEMKRYDANTIREIGIPGVVLMERAALAAMEVVLARLGEGRPGTAFGGCGTAVRNADILILAGVGNNGGDGLALARLLEERGADVTVWCVGDEGKATEQWQLQRKALEGSGVKFSSTPEKTEYTILADALFGVGLSREVSGIYREAVERFNELKGYKVALDMPSGIDSDTGRVWGCAVQADETVSFGFCKRGLVLYPGCNYAGRVSVAQIGINERSFLGQTPGMFYCDSPGDMLPRRDPFGNKGTFGKVLLVAGSPGMAGAAVLAARAAYRSGAGMVKVITDAQNRVILQSAVPEALFGTYEELEDSLSWADVIAVGPGLGKDARAQECLVQVLEHGSDSCPLLIDADGLNMLAGDEKLQALLSTRTLRDAEGISSRQGRDTEVQNVHVMWREVILTPHVGELSRLTGISVEQLKENLPFYAMELAERLRVTVVAKDARTFVCRQGRPVFVNLAGNSGMATAGSGDVLAGALAGLMAQTIRGGGDLFMAVCAGVGMHAAAGDRAAAEKGEYAVMAGDIAEAL